MKNILKLLGVPCLLLSAVGLTACGGNGSSSSGSSSSSSSSSATSHTNPDLSDADLILYFYRFDENYTDVGAWFWGTGDGRGLMFDGTQTSVFEKTGDWQWLTVGIEFDKEYTVFTDWNFSNTETLTLTEDYWSNIIIRDKAGSKDVDADRKLDLTQVDDDGIIRVYSITGNETIFYDMADVPTSPVNEVYFTTTKTIATSMYYAPTTNPTKDTVKITDAANRNYPIAKVTKSGLTYTFELETAYTDYTQSLLLKYEDSTYTVNFRGVYKTDEFNALYKYDGKDLGAVVSPDSSKTTFKLWSPSATEVKVNFYDSAVSAAIKESFSMTKGEKGVWSYEATGDMHAKYYTYTVTVFGKTNAEVADPYAASSNANGVRSMVVNWSKITTGLTSAAPSVATPSSVSVYETHVRDFSADDSWNGTATNKGKYLGMVETGTALGTGEKTGFDYVKDLGITHIQLQPVYDFASVDETKLDDAAYQKARRGGIYNWGYDPYSYSSLEGSYSSNPNDGLTRINEFRQLTNAYNTAGIGVIMDVVYNHMPSGSNSTYEKIMPNYYFRTNSYSGAGTDLASENGMVQNMLVQTTEQLTKHYNLAGFRFDLMGLITAKAMKAVDTNLRSFDPDIVLYGEGWDMYQGDKFLGNESQGKQSAFRDSDIAKEAKIGYFNDSFRDGIKGSVFNADEKGYLQLAYEGVGTEALRKKALTGMFATQNMMATGLSAWATHFSGVSVNYVEAHDNLTLHDKLYATNPEMTEGKRNAMQTLANSMVALSTGVSFFQLGQEFARSKEMPASWLEGADAVTEKYTKVGSGATAKYFVNDSYNFSDEINAVDWNLLKTNNAMVNSFKAVLALRRSAVLADLKPASLDGYAYDVISNTELGVTAEDYANIIGYSIAKGTGETKPVSLRIVFNVANKAAALTGSVLGTSATKIYLNGAEVTEVPSSLPAASYLVVAY